MRLTLITLDLCSKFVHAQYSGMLSVVVGHDTLHNKACTCSFIVSVFGG